MDRDVAGYDEDLVVAESGYFAVLCVHGFLELVNHSFELHHVVSSEPADVDDADGSSFTVNVDYFFDVSELVYGEWSDHRVWSSFRSFCCVEFYVVVVGDVLRTIGRA